MNISVRNYNLFARIMHWFSAVTIIALFMLGLWMVNLDYYSQWYYSAPYYHRSIGISLAMITIIRLSWKGMTLSPKISGKPFEVVAAKIVHALMYAVLFTLFISGYLISTSDGRGIEVFNWFTVPSLGELFSQQSDKAGLVHFYAGWAIISLAVIHILAACKHHFINKDDTLRKMIGVSK